MRMQMDDKTFQAFLLDTQVMLTKDHGKWNFDTLQELVEGPLHNPKRMEEAIKVSRYIRKLMSFFHPMAHRFSGLPKTKVDLLAVLHQLTADAVISQIAERTLGAAWVFIT